VSVSIEFLTTPPSGSRPTNPEPVHLIVPENTKAYDILTLAAKENPSYKFTTKEDPPYGHFVTSIDGVCEDEANKKYWMMYSDPHTLAPTGVDNFYPKNGSCTIFKYQIAESSRKI
jgi:hypothetical protein